MVDQWQALLQNLGEWHGSFTQLTPTGEEIGDTPTIVSFVGLNNNQTVRQTVRRLTIPPQDKVLEYSTLGRNLLFFENGAFSTGSMQFAPFSEFGAELGLIWQERRLRLVQLYNTANNLYQLTLIREQLAGSDALERPPLTVHHLLGTWQGEAVTLYPDLRHPDIYPTKLSIDQPATHQLHQKLSFSGGQTVDSIATIKGDRLLFESNAQSVQVLLLPDGASSTCPLQIRLGHPFFLEVGWLLEPTLRQRMIRSYNSKGEWVSLTLITERKVSPKV
jgi:hypothetical protein